MAINRIDPRISIKASTVTGVTPSIPSSYDHTDSSWVDSDIYPYEFMLNAVDDRLWIRTDNGVKEIDLIGASAGVDYLPISGGTMSGNIEMPNGGRITSDGNTGAMLYFDAGANDSFLLSTDGTNLNDTYLWARKGSFTRLWSVNDPIDIFANNSRIYIGDNYNGIRLQPNAGRLIEFNNGGSLICSVTASGIEMNSGKSIISGSGESKIDFDYSSVDGVMNLYGSKAVSIFNDYGGTGSNIIAGTNSLIINLNESAGNGVLSIGVGTPNIVMYESGNFMSLTADSVNINVSNHLQVQGDISVIGSGDLYLGSNSNLYLGGVCSLDSRTVAGVGTASGFTGSMVYISNESGGAVPAFSDGTHWRRVTDRAIIS